MYINILSYSERGSENIVKAINGNKEVSVPQRNVGKSSSYQASIWWIAGHVNMSYDFLSAYLLIR